MQMCCVGKKRNTCVSGNFEQNTQKDTYINTVKILFVFLFIKFWGNFPLAIN